MKYISVLRRSTQLHLRVLVDIYAVVLILLYCGTILFVGGGLRLSIHRDYLFEMFRRLGYVSSMLLWAGSVDVLRQSKAIFTQYGDTVPFNLTVVPLLDSQQQRNHASSFRANVLTEPLSSASSSSLPLLGASAGLSEGSPVRLTNPTFPFAVAYDDPLLNATVELQEVFRSVPRLGCASENNFTGVCFLFLSLLTLYTMVKVGNLLVQRFPSRRYVGYGVAGVGLCAPLVLWVGMVIVLTDIGSQCLQHTIMDNLRRSAQLYGTLYSMLFFGYGVQVDAYFPSTMLAMNSEFITNEKYGVSTVSNSVTDNDFHPPLSFLSSTVVKAFAEHGGDMASYSGYFTEERTFVATFPLPEVNGALVVAQVYTHSSNPMASKHVLIPLLVFFLPLVVVTALALYLFPFAILGAAAPMDRHQKDRFAFYGPWAWRVSPYWPVWKVLHGAFILCLVLGGITIFSSVIIRFRAITDTFTLGFAGWTNSFTALQHGGDLLFTNMASLVLAFTWDPDFLRFILAENTTDALVFYHFYEALSNALRQTQYEGLSAANALQEEVTSYYPLLRSSTFFTTFYENAIAKQSTTVDEGYEGWLYLNTWDMQYLRGVLMNAESVLEENRGSAFDGFRRVSLALQMEESDFWTQFHATTAKGEKYLAIAQFYHQQPTDILGPLFSSKEGIEVTAAEGSAVQSGALRLSSLKVFFYFFWNWFPTFAPLMACLLLSGLAALFDVYYVGLFFGYAPWNWGFLGENHLPSVTSKSTRTLPSNDDTASSLLLVVNHTALLHAANKLSLSILGIVLVALVMVIASYGVSVSSTGYLIDALPSAVLLAENDLTEAYSTSFISSTSALWLRALLSMQLKDIALGIQANAAWFRTNRVRFVKGSEPSPVFRSDVDFLAAGEISHLTRLVAAQLGSPPSQVASKASYDDYATYLGILDTFYDFNLTWNCMENEEVLNVSTELVNFMEGLVKQNEAASCTAIQHLTPLLTLYSGKCGIDVGLKTYLERLVLLSARVEVFSTRARLTQALRRRVEQVPDLSVTTRILKTYKGSTNYDAIGVLFNLCLILTWVSVPLLLLLIGKSKELFSCIYFG